jgi:hypothetical protein
MSSDIISSGSTDSAYSSLPTASTAANAYISLPTASTMASYHVPKRQSKIFVHKTEDVGVCRVPHFHRCRCCGTDVLSGAIDSTSPDACCNLCHPRGDCPDCRARKAPELPGR